MARDYAAFLDNRRHLSSADGFAPTYSPAAAFDFQRHLIDWATRQGRAALFADCGLGKTIVQLAWAQNVVEHTNGRVLILTPLAVSHQTVREAEKFGIKCNPPGAIGNGISVMNYEKIHTADACTFVGLVCDESSILKNVSGARRAQITAFMRKMRYRLLCTATAAPNDYFELGTHSEALGHLGYMDMLNRFFKNDANNSAINRAYQSGPKWRLKPHAEGPFWRWVASWAIAVRKPSDLGFPDDGWILPPLTERCHIVSARTLADGFLLALPSVGLVEQREEARRTVHERAEKIAELVTGNNPALVWCALNTESRALKHAIADSVEVSGADSDDVKTAKFLSFAQGRTRVLITKPKIGGFGLNFQHCNHVTFFPTHSFEQYYQGVRRCWRFGQTRPVTVDVVATEGSSAVLKNLQTKAAAADEMFARITALIGAGHSLNSARAFPLTDEIPSWA